MMVLRGLFLSAPMKKMVKPNLVISGVFLVGKHDSIRGCVHPLVDLLVGMLGARSVALLVSPLFGLLVGQSVMLLSQRAETSRQTTYFVYTNLFFAFWL